VYSGEWADTVEKVGVFWRIFASLVTERPFGSGFCRLVCRRPALLTVQVMRWPPFERTAGGVWRVFGGSERWRRGEFVLCAIRSSKPEPREVQDALQVGEQHLDLFPFVS